MTSKSLSHGYYKRNVAEEIHSFVETEYEDFEMSTGSPHLWGYFEAGTNSDIRVWRRITEFPEELSSIDNIERWFPEKTLRAPVLGINISSNQFRRSNMASLTQEIINEIIERDRDWPREITLFTNPFSEDQPMGKVEPDGYYMGLDLENQDEINEYLLPEVGKILDEAESSSAEELTDIGDFVSDFKPTVFHFNEIKHAYENGRTGPLILLLSVFFESHCFQKLESFFLEIRKNPEAGMIIDKESDNFEKILNMCRYFDLIEENEYRVIKKTKKSRNKYAHKLESYHFDEATPLEEDEDIDLAIEIYENLIGIENSIVSSS